MESEANDDILDVHQYGKTNCFLCCPWCGGRESKRWYVWTNELAKLQRTAFIGITGAFRATPTEALEVDIGLTPLPLWIEWEARACYFRICRFGDVTQRGNIAHLNFSRDTVLENMFNMRTDTVILRYSFADIHSDIPWSQWMEKKLNIQCISKGPV